MYFLNIFQINFAKYTLSEKVGKAGDNTMKYLQNVLFFPIIIVSGLSLLGFLLLNSYMAIGCLF